MIRSLRRKFIAISALSFAAALIVILGYINISNYSDVLDTADERIELIAQNKGQLQPGTKPSSQSGGQRDTSTDAAEEESSRDKWETTEEPSEENTDSQPQPPEKKDEPSEAIHSAFDDRNTAIREAAFDSRYFYVKFDSDGKIVYTNVNNIASVSSDEARDLAQSLYDSGKTKGLTSSFRYSQYNTEDGSVYIFFDCSRELNTFYSFLKASILTAVIGLTIVFFLVFILSKRAIKPVIESYEKQKQFITDASHELKTPLAIISAANEVSEIESGETEWTKSIDKQIKRMTSLTEKLVMLSRMDEEGYEPNKTDFSLSDAIAETAGSFEAVAEQKNKRYNVNIESGINYTGDANAIKQLASLLIDNAMKYSADGGYINVSLKKSGRNAELKVENSVEEIEKGRHDELFERFYRSDKSRNSSTGGHGIGLSVAKAIVQTHKGKLSAVSPDTKTIVFTAQL